MDASDAYDNFFTHTYDVPMGRCSNRYVVCVRKTCIDYTMRELLNSHRLPRDNYSTSTQCTCSTYIKHAWRRRMSYTDPWNGSFIHITGKNHSCSDPPHVMWKARGLYTYNNQNHCHSFTYYNMRNSHACPKKGCPVPRNPPVSAHVTGYI